jgi:hypothetical protein
MKVNTVFMGDRLSRGGDTRHFSGRIRRGAHLHAERDLCNQHRATDLLANMSVPYGEGGR